ncbi:hypothetical protein HpHA199_02280 [Helicobacter pylori]
MTKVNAIKKVMEDNKGIVSWTILYNQIEKYYPSIRASKEWEAGLRGVLYREIRNHKNFKKSRVVIVCPFGLSRRRAKRNSRKPHSHAFLYGRCLRRNG